MMESTKTGEAGPGIADPAAKASKRAQKARQKQQAPESRQTQESGQRGLRMHTVHANVPIPYLTPDDLLADVRAVGSKLPSLPPKRLAFYGGLGALAAAGAIDWPVALAIGAATVVARGRGDDKAEEGEEPKEQKEHAGQQH